MNIPPAGCAGQGPRGTGGAAERPECRAVRGAGVPGGAGARRRERNGIVRGPAERRAPAFAWCPPGGAARSTALP